MTDAIIAHLYQEYPALREAEQESPRLGNRRFALEYLPKHSIGAELGVFTGRFSQEILRTVQPAKLYLVDPWWLAYGHYPAAWGAFAAHGRLSTKAAHAATVARTHAAAGTNGAPAVEWVIDRGADWLADMPDQSLDWVYLDTSHEYGDSVRELAPLARVLKPDGIILGDDWANEPGHAHYGLYRAVQEFIAATDFRIIFAGPEQQWMLRR